LNTLETGFSIKHPKLTLGYTPLRASTFISNADIRHTLMLTSNSDSYSLDKSSG